MKFFKVAKGNLSADVLCRQIESGSFSQIMTLDLAELILDTDIIKSEKEMLRYTSLFLDICTARISNKINMDKRVEDSVCTAFISMCPILEYYNANYKELYEITLLHVKDNSFTRLAYQYFYIPYDAIVSRLFETANSLGITVQMLNTLGMSFAMQVPNRRVLAEWGDCSVSSVSEYLKENKLMNLVQNWLFTVMQYQEFLSEAEMKCF